jgi:hypothetical protein
MLRHGFKFMRNRTIKNLFKPRLKKLNYSTCPVCNIRLSRGTEPAHLRKEHPDYKSDLPEVIYD